MILLDTNVISETMRVAPDERVIAWLDQQIAEQLYLSSVTVAELSFGMQVLVDGKRKSSLLDLLEQVLRLFDGRILPFDLSAAQHYAQLAATAKQYGRGFPTPDGYPAIASAHGFTVATRDLSAFRAVGIKVINPWLMD